LKWITIVGIVAAAISRALDLDPSQIFIFHTAIFAAQRLVVVRSKLIHAV
jgi:hypothetical protein